MNNRTVISLAIASVLLGGCVNHTFAPGPGMSEAQFEPDSARCRMMARGMDPSFAFGAAGSARFVAAATAGAAIGSAIGTAVRENENFNDCMEMRGWRVVDRKPGQTGSGAMGATLAGAVIATPLPVPAASHPAEPPPPVASQASTSTPAPAVQRRKLGVVVRPVAPRGLIVMSVEPASAAASSGMTEGDIMLDFGGTAVMTPHDLQGRVTEVGAGTSVVAQVLRDGRQLSVTLNF